PHQPAESAAQGQPGHTGVADGAVGTDQAVALGGGVESPEERTGLHGGDPPVGIDGHLLHGADIDHDAGVTGGEPRVAVATAAHRHRQLPVAGEAQRGGDVGRGGAAGDQCRTAVGGGIPDPPGLVVAGVGGRDQAAGEARPESLQPGSCPDRHDRPRPSSVSMSPACAPRLSAACQLRVGCSRGGGRRRGRRSVIIVALAEDGRDSLQYGMLGPLEVRTDRGVLRLASRRQRVLLTVLLVEANRAVSAGRLMDELWGEVPPTDPEGALRTQISRLRKALGPGAGLVTEERAYRLTVGREQLDAARFEDLMGLIATSGADGADTLRLLDEALALWRGPALAEFADRRFAQPEAVRLEELRLTARERRAELLLRLGRAADAAAELDA